MKGGGALVIVGLQWGDEGKGKVSYLLSRRASYVVRYQGGANAGHTVVVGQRRMKFHMLPAGSAAGAAPCIAAGCVIDVRRVLEELELLKQLGYGDRLYISHAANVVLEEHKALDAHMEEARGSPIGTTRQGIGPAYADRALRAGIRVEDLTDSKLLDSKLRLITKLHGCERLTSSEELAQTAGSLAKYVADIPVLLNDAIRNGEHIVLEGAQGTLLDIDHGTYPYVTSSNTVAGAACASCGLSPRFIESVVGVAKAYATRVGSGPFPTEELGGEGQLLREAGGEYGTTTGRPRRVGWLDLPLLRYACMLNGVEWIALTKLDVLASVEKIKVCVAYVVDDGEISIASPHVLARGSVKPVYEEFSSWNKLSTEEARHIAAKGWDELPTTMREYVESIEKMLGIPIRLASIGEETGLEVWR